MRKEEIVFKHTGWHDHWMSILEQDFKKELKTQRDLYKGKSETSFEKSHRKKLLKILQRCHRDTKKTGAKDNHEIKLMQSLITVMKTNVKISENLKKKKVS